MLLAQDLAVTERLRAAQEDYHRSRVIGQHDKTLLYQDLWRQFDEVERARGHRFLTRQRPVTPVTRFEYLEPLRLAQNEELIDEQGIRDLLNFSVPTPAPVADPWDNGISQTGVGYSLPVDAEESSVDDFEDIVTQTQGITQGEGADWSDYDQSSEDEDDVEDSSAESWEDSEDDDEEYYVEQPDDLADDDEDDSEEDWDEYEDESQYQGISSAYEGESEEDDDDDEEPWDESEDAEDTSDYDESYLEEPSEVIQPAPLPEVKQSQVTTSAYEVPTNLRDFIKEYPGCSLQDALKYFSARDVNKQIRLGRVVNRQGRLYL